MTGEGGRENDSEMCDGKDTRKERKEVPTYLPTSTKTPTIQERFYLEQVTGEGGREGVIARCVMGKIRGKED